MEIKESGLHFFRVLILASFLTSFMAGEPRSQYVDFVGSTLWASMRDVIVADGYAFCTFPSGLMTLDVSDPYNIEYSSELNLEGSAHCLDLSGNYLYVADDFAGLKIIDISDPLTPLLSGSYDSRGYTLDVHVVGDYAYVADGGNGFLVLDISDPTSPAYAGGTIPAGSFAETMTIQNNYAYVIDSDNMQIIDISDPSNPGQEGYYEIGVGPEAIAVKGEYVYVGNQTHNLHVISVNDPMNPALYRTIEFPNNINGLTVDGNLLYAAVSWHGLLTYDISDPSNPVPLSSLNTEAHPDRIFVDDTLAYVTCRVLGLNIIDIADSLNPSFVSRYEGANFNGNISVYGNYAFVCYGSIGKIVFVDISDPAHPYPFGQYLLQDTKKAMLEGDFLYVADGIGGLKILNFADPYNPYMYGIYSPANVKGIFIRDNYIYLADYNYGLKILEISNPMIPSMVGSCECYDAVTEVFFQGDYAYLSGDVGTFFVVDVSDPADPIIAATISTAEEKDVFVNGEYAYVATDDGAWIINISDPHSPYPIGIVPSADWTENIVIQDNIIYMADYAAGVELFDILNPDIPLLIDTFNTIGTAMDVCVSGEYIYVADRHSMTVLRYNQTGSDCAYYVPGDVNYNGSFNGLDVVYGITFFKGGPEPIFSCECTPGNTWYVSGDVNASCNFNGLDVTYMVAYFKGGPDPQPCADCPPVG